MYRAKPDRNKTGFSITLLITGLFLLSACQSHSTATENPSSTKRPEKLVVLPFKDMASIYGEGVSVRSPLSGKVFMTGEIVQGANEILEQHLISLLRARNDFILIPTSQAQGVLSGLLKNYEDTLSDRNIAVKTGIALDVDAVVLGYIYRFSQRVGARYSAKFPASVAFDIYLIDVETGRILWRGNFDETQRPLSEDLFQVGTFIKRKGGWITAKEMAHSALDKIFLTFP
ncbi:MAG: hypothetical protein JRF71_02540 [Deltaproteobacteria bacterium]|nr:hypothetical protein [Deltaproteobacteria bacterium]